MDDLMEQEERLTKLEKMLELPFIFLVVSFILYSEIVSSCFYSIPALKWVASVTQIKQHFGVYILTLLAFGVIYALVLPVLEAILAWAVNEGNNRLKAMSAEHNQSFSRKDGIWSWFSLEIEADKQQSNYLQNKVTQAREKHLKSQRELHTLAQRALAVLVMGITNYCIAEAGIIQTALQYSAHTKCLIIFCLLFVIVVYFYAVIEAYKELQIHFKPKDNSTVLMGSI